MTFALIIAVLVLALIIGAGLALSIWQRQMQYWLPSYFSPSPKQRHNRRQVRNYIDEALANESVSDRKTHIFIAICDHYEPEVGRPDFQIARSRVDRWCVDYPNLFSSFRDLRGKPPQQTCFFPQDEYHPELVDRLSMLCDDGFGDVDIHLHHDHDTAKKLRDKLESFRDTLFQRHGLLRRDPESGEIVYGFIHGNWALCNSRRDGRWCGVDNEITILRETGCYADFTMPSAPSDTQTRTINSIYYAKDIQGQTKSHDSGVLAQLGRRPPDDSLLMIQGPLGLDWRNRKWGLLPRTENGDIHAGFGPSWARLHHWLRSGVHVAGRPNWVFVKLHTHGCKDGNIDLLLGQQMVQFHEKLARHAESNDQFRYYYVSAWEMAQLVHQAEQGIEQPEFEPTLLSTVP